MYFANALSQFQRLESESPAPLVAAQSLATFHGKAVLFGLTLEKVLFLIPDTKDNLSPAGGIGLNSLRLEKVRLDLAGLWVGDYLAVTAQRSSFDLNLFAAICDEMVKGLGMGKEPIELIEQVAGRWRSLLSMEELDEASLSQIVGLFGELYVLSELATELTPGGALASWVGADKARHDFEFTSVAFEVKTSRVLNRTVAQIHGLQQLAASPNTQLNVCHIQVEWSPDGFDIPSFVAALKSKFSPAEVADFDAKVSLAKFTPERIENSGVYKFKITRCALFSVEADFPKITRLELENFGAINAHLTSINYGLSLDGLPFTDITGNPGGKLAEIVNTSSI